MTQLALITLCGIRCLAIPISAARSLIASVQHAVQRMSFLAPVPVSSFDGACALLPFKLLQVQYLTGHVPGPPQTHEEVQA